MLLVIATLLAGLGLFFVGLKLLTENLKLLSGRKLRENIAVWTRNPFSGLAWGGLFITITQSAAAATFILIGMLRAGMLNVRQILPILIGMNSFGGLIVMVLIFDIKVAIFFLLGVTGMIYSRDRGGSMRAAAGAAFGIGLLFLGLNTTQTGIAPLAEMPWFEEALQSSQGSFFIALFVGLALSFITQSALAVMILTIAFLQANLLTLEQGVMIAYGAKLGSSLLTYVLAAGLNGEPRQVSTFQVQFNVLGALILVPAFFLEVYAEVPLMLALVAQMSSDTAMQLALVNLLFNVVPGVLVFPLVGPITMLLAGIYPQTAEEQLSRPKYLLGQSADDPHNALRLVELEQTRLIEILVGCFEAMRVEGGGRRLEQLAEGFNSLSEAVRGAIDDLSNHQQLSPLLYERLNGLLNIQHHLEITSTEVHSLARELAALRGTGRGERFSRVAIDGIDAILLTFQDVARDRTELDATLLKQMTSEDGITRVRKAYLADDTEEALSASTRMQLLAAANHCERLIWLFGEMGETYGTLE